MALEHDRRPPLGGLAESVRSFAGSAMDVAGAIASVVRPWRDGMRNAIRQALGAIWAVVGPWATSQPMWRFWTRSIGRRILAANLVGFVVLFAGILIVSQSNRWLIEAKLESLTTQSRLIAVAIASNSPKGDGMRISFDPDRPADGDTGAIPGDLEAFTSIQMAIAPERVTPILSRLIPHADVRARVYGRDGALVTDSANRLTRGQLTRIPQKSETGADGSGEKVRNMLTRFMAWFVRSELPVYRDIVGNERGSTFPEIARALEGNVTRMLLISRNSEQIVAVASPILQLGRVEGAVLLSSRPGEIDELIWRQRRALMVLLSLALLATLLASWLLSRTIAGPMRRLSEAADHVSQSINARQELPDFPGRRDEVGHMAEAFRDMTAALFRRIEASDKFAQDVTHELKNPVAAARARAETLGYAKTDEQRAEMVGEIQHELKRLNRLITDVANASRLDAELALQETEPIDIGRIAAAIVGVFNDLHAASGRKVLIRTSSTGDTRDPFMVIGHEGRISQVFTNLIDNALSFSPEGGAVRVTLRREGRDVLATVDDDGPGIPPDKLEDVFKRFYSDRPQTDGTQGKNSGLGLSISREIVFAHGGRLTAENRPAVPGEVASVREQPDLKARRVPGVAGARFVMRLPAGDATGGRR